MGGRACGGAALRASRKRRTRGVPRAMARLSRMGDDVGAGAQSTQRAASDRGVRGGRSKEGRAEIEEARSPPDVRGRKSEDERKQAGVLRAASPYPRDPAALFRSCSACFACPTGANSPCLRCAAAAWRLHPHALWPLCALGRPLRCAFSFLTSTASDPMQPAHSRRRLLPLHVFRVFLGHFCSFWPDNPIFELPSVVAAWCRRLVPSICCSRRDRAQQRRARGDELRELQRCESGTLSCRYAAFGALSHLRVDCWRPVKCRVRRCSARRNESAAARRAAQQAC